jgi:trk system potassium uptake protein TrkA
MRTLIVGGGKVGSYLAQELEKSGHAVTVIEYRKDQAADVGEATKALVLYGDGTDIRLLEEGDVHRADWVLAVTGKDEDNIVACQLATTLGAQRVLARLNDPKNRPTFDALNIPVVSVTDLMAQVIGREVEIEVGDAVRIALLGRGQVSVVELDVPDDCPPQRVIDMSLPSPTILVAITRGEAVIVPGAATVVEPGDRVVAITNVENETHLRAVLCGGS